MNLYLEGWNYHVHRGSPGNFESRNLSRDNLCKEIGRNPNPQVTNGTFTPQRDINADLSLKELASSPI